MKPPRKLTKGWSLRHAFRSSPRRAIAIPDILGCVTELLLFLLYRFQTNSPIICRKTNGAKVEHWINFLSPKRNLLDEGSERRTTNDASFFLLLSLRFAFPLPHPSQTIRGKVSRTPAAAVPKLTSILAPKQSCGAGFLHFPEHGTFGRTVCIKLSRPLDLRVTKIAFFAGLANTFEHTQDLSTQRGETETANQKSEGVFFFATQRRTNGTRCYDYKQPRGD